MKTTINWRKYPEQKPPTEEYENHTVLYDDETHTGLITSLGYAGGKWVESEEGAPIEERMDHSQYVRAFALPSDITTEEE